MSLDYSDEETDRLLAAVDVADIESPPAPSPEILGVVQETPTDKATTSDQGMAPLNGSEGELRRGEDPCQGPTPVTLDMLSILTCTLRKAVVEPKALGTLC